MIKNKFLIWISFPILITNSLYSQNKPVIKQETGILLFSSSQDKFLDTIQVTDDINFVVIPDLFFPMGNVDKRHSILSNLFTKTIKKGIDVGEKIDNREFLKLKASRFLNIDSTNQCYPHGEFRLLPVRLKYQVVNKYDSGPDCYSPVSIGTNDSSFKFTYTSREIRIVSIEQL